MTNLFSNDPDFDFISHQMNLTKDSQKTFSLVGEQYSQERINEIVKMLNSSRYEARVVKIQGNPAIHVKTLIVNLELETISLTPDFEPEVVSSAKLSAKISGSQSISYIEWEDGFLGIQFTSGNTIYKWGDVPIQLFYDFEAANSHGSFFHQNVKNAGFSEVK